MAKFAINSEVSSTDFFPEIEAQRYKREGDYVLFFDEQGEIVDCIAASLIQRIRLLKTEETSKAWVKKMSVDGLAAGTVKTRYSNVRSILRGAVKDKLLAANPADGITLPARGRRKLP